MFNQSVQMKSIEIEQPADAKLFRIENYTLDNDCGRIETIWYSSEDGEQFLYNAVTDTWYTLQPDPREMILEAATIVGATSL